MLPQFSLSGGRLPRDNDRRLIEISRPQDRSSRRCLAAGRELRASFRYRPPAPRAWRTLDHKRADAPLLS